MSEVEKVHCLIIGSGPAGYTAAIYASRANMNPILYQGTQPGGQLTTTNEVENFPGYPEGVTGPEMMVQLQEQAKRFGTDIRDGWVTRVDFSGPVHKVWIHDNKEIHCDTVIISTGATAKYLGLPSEQHYLQMGGGVSACAVCDGFFFRDHEIAVIGGGDSAVEEATFLTKFASKVTLVHRRDAFKAAPASVNKMKELVAEGKGPRRIRDGSIRWPVPPGPGTTAAPTAGRPPEPETVQGPCRSADRCCAPSRCAPPARCSARHRR